MRFEKPYFKSEWKNFSKNSVAQEVLYHSLKGANILDNTQSCDFFTFLLVEKGSGVHYIDTVTYEVGSLQVHMVFPGQIHKWKFESGTTGHLLRINKSLFERIASVMQFSMAEFNEHFVIQLDEHNYSKILAEFHLIQKELEKTPFFSTLITLRCKIIALLVKMQAEIAFDDLGIYRKNPMIYKFQNLVEANFKEQKPISFYAKQLNITSNYLSILCKQKLKISALSVIQRRLLSEAQKLLQSSNMTIKEIAFELGFNEPTYFSNFFKQKMGLSPRQFKKQSWKFNLYLMCYLLEMLIL